jgi:hypothetical protein
VRDNAPVAAGTASIAGTVVVAGEPKQPARRVRVTLTDLARTSPGRTTTTDDLGAFAFDGLPAGRFELQAFKPGICAPVMAPRGPNAPGTPIVVGTARRLRTLPSPLRAVADHRRHAMCAVGPFPRAVRF